MKLVKRPFFIFWLQDYQWMTVKPWIFYPRNVDLNDPRYAPLVKHESVHIKQQKNMGTIKWLFKYLTDKKFQLSQELEGIAVECISQPNDFLREKCIDDYARGLSEGKDYTKLVASKDDAKKLILNAINKL